MKKIFKGFVLFFGIVVIFSIIFFLFFSFISLHLDIALWSWDMRVVYSMLVLSCSALIFVSEKLNNLK